MLIELEWESILSCLLLFLLLSSRCNTYVQVRVDGDHISGTAVLVVPVAVAVVAVAF